MSFPRYPDYKDSGVEWLGDVPAHWEVGSARWLTRRYSGGTPDKTNLAYWEDGTIPWLNSGAVNDRLITAPSTYITAEAFANSSAKWIPKGALVMALAGQGKTKGMVAQLAIPSTCNQSMAAIIPGAEIDARFLFWWLESNYQNIRNMAGGDLRDGLNLELLGSIQCPLPLQGEQTQIAAFLDRETAKIDELVREQRRLMELLKEKRQAVISHAVTRGLNPHAPMKPSGVEWLGDVPEHWAVISLKRFCDVRDGTHDTPQFIDTSDVSFPFVTSKDLMNGQVSLDETKHVSATDYHEISRRSGVARGDVLMPMIGSIGGAVLVETDVHFAIKNIALFKASINYNSRWLQLMLDSDLSVLQFALNRSGGVQGFVALGTLRNLSFPFPSLDEQGEIVSFLAIETAKFDTLTEEAQQAIDLLQERRTALISAAVTGQIDVRPFVEREAA